MENTYNVHVGRRSRIAVIPEGWRRITAGICLAGDMFAHTVTAKWHLVDEEDIGMPADSFDALIRINSSKMLLNKDEAISKASCD